MCGLDMTVTGLGACLGGIFSSVCCFLFGHLLELLFCTTSLLINRTAILLIDDTPVALYFEMFKEEPITQGASGMFFEIRHGDANESEAGETARLRFMWVTPILYALMLFWPL